MASRTATPARLSRKLATLTATLLGASAGCANAAGTDNPWQLDIGFLGYAEKDRNHGIELLSEARRELADGDELTLGLEFDTLTGATPNGATPADTVQTFTQSSGQGTYSAAPNTLPADDTHMDIRLAVSAAYRDQRAGTLRFDHSARMSMEFDYLSLGAGTGATIALDRGNTELNVAIYGEYNAVHPVGSKPDPFSEMTPANTLQNRGSASVRRSAAEASIGLTQTLDRHSLLQLRYTRSLFDGYLTDPYKMLSVVQPADADAPGSPVTYRFESRPRERQQNTLYLSWRRQFEPGIATVSARASKDTWDMRARELELRFRAPLKNGAWWQPILRWYRQEGASFHTPFLIDGEPLPRWASADFRLADFDALTAGVRYGLAPRRGQRWVVGLDYYTQWNDTLQQQAFGILDTQTLFPRFEMLLLHVNWRVDW